MPHAGTALADEDLALNTDNGGNVRAPVGVEQGACWIEDADDTALVAVLAPVANVSTPERKRIGAPE